MESFSKQEYIQLHGLFREVADYADEVLDGSYEAVEDVESYSRYKNLDVGPRDIHKTKSDHREAVFLLSDSVTEFLEGEKDLKLRKI